MCAILFLLGVIAVIFWIYVVYYVKAATHAEFQYFTQDEKIDVNLI